ncbi:SMI1/KNR4 family protein [Pseudonocardia sp. ICBG1293]|uniref:SMI1/KNR4 family protein n=1 Tax=Pseudonocardia sp. ICBG1293 TaxID=2844382 RepID=UPI001CCE6CA6|nr:SMI1/KNR4 family protein [Pseudonocardia sp. ICBG1293]
MDPWVKIYEWCAENAPETGRAVLPGGPTLELDTAQGRTGGYPWPEDVLAFYEWCNGTLRTPNGYILPGLRPLGVAEIVSSWEEDMISSYDHLTAGTSPPSFEESDARGTFFAQLGADAIAAKSFDADKLAGSATGGFIPSLLPVAEDQSGSYLMIDRRGGKEFGAAVFFDKVDADLNDAPRWKSFLALSRATLQAVISETSEEQTGLTPIALGGRLTWQ